MRLFVRVSQMGQSMIQMDHCIIGTSMLIEDVACPVDKLADMTLDLVEMFQKFGYKDASCFGHALEGNLHLVFSQVSSLAGGLMQFLSFC